jgi:hypothetical protein
LTAFHQVLKVYKDEPLVLLLYSLLTIVFFIICFLLVGKFLCQISVPTITILAVQTNTSNMSRKQIIKGAVSVAGVAIGIAMSKYLIHGASALPTASPKVFYELAPEGFGTFIYPSKVAATIFGADATDFDYHLASESNAAIEALAAYTTAHASGDESQILITFLNTTGAGLLNDNQANNLTYLCNELSGSMASHVSLCASIVIARDVIDRDSSDSELEKRSRWNWIKSGGHVASNAAVNILYGALGNALYDYFPKSPRSWCNTANGATACFSWSTVESFQHYYAQQFVSDALGAVDFNSNSAQANKVLGSKRSVEKRSAADVCISNRADGCT